MAEVDGYERSEERDGLRIDWQVPVAMEDGMVLRADVYRPPQPGRYPVVLSYGPYAKGLAFQDGYGTQWERMTSAHPDVAEGSSNKYQSWEVVDPEKWVPDGYACVRVDSRGTGWSPGYVDVWSPRETEDLYQCIEWAAGQSWSSGKVGLCGISYYAINQWLVAGRQPPHLAALIPWEGSADFYRDSTHHGGILSEFCANWYRRQVETVQYGVGSRAPTNPNTGESVAGPETLSEEQLVSSRADLGQQLKDRVVDDGWYQARSANWSKVSAPFLSAANWGGQGLHPRGNFEAFTRAASPQKWLEVHGEEHWTHFYTDYGVSLQKRFFDHFLKGTDNGWDTEPPVQLNIRYPGERFELRKEQEWPLGRTVWTRLYLDADQGRLQEEQPYGASSLTYEALGDGVHFDVTLPDRTEITGPLATKLYVSSSTEDADFFVVLSLFDPDGDEVTFRGALDPNTPIAQGWLRASHRRLDPDLSLAYRPYHSHDRVEPLTPGTIYELDIEIWPTCIVAPAGYRLSLSIRGKDYQFQGPLDEFAKTFYYANRGVGPFTHNDPDDRPPSTFGGEITLYTGGDHPSFVLLPVIPPAGGQETQEV